MINKLILKSKNYSYVYHSGNFQDMTFMGISDEILQKEDKLKVYCFIHVNYGLEENLKEVDVEYLTKSTFGDLYTNIDKGATIVQSINCVNEFYSEIVNSGVISDLDCKYYLVNKETNIGVRCLDDFIAPYVRVLYDSECNILEVVDFSTLLEDKVIPFRKSIKKEKLNNFLKRVGVNSNKYFMLCLAENENNLFIKYFNIENTVVGNTKELDVEVLRKPDYVFESNKQRYLL